MPIKPKIIIPDAQVIIDMHRMAFWHRIIHIYDIGITPIIVKESQFYKNAQGEKQPILLQKDIDAKLIRLIPTTVDQLMLLHKLLKPTIQSPLDAGELEAIAFLKSQKSDDHLFCSGDALAVKYLGALGLRHRAISLHNLLEKKNVKVKLEHKYSEDIFQKMLSEGFRDSQFLLR